MSRAPHRRRVFSRGAALLLLLLAGLLSAPATGRAAEAACADGQNALRLGVTPALLDSGFLAYLVRPFEEETGIRVEPLADTTWNLHTSARDCRMDAFFSDIPEVEHSAMLSGLGKDWIGGFYSHYLLVGPRGNPNAISTASILEGMAAIAAKQAPFASSRDGGAVHQTELYLWRLLRTDDVFLAPWYITAEPDPCRLLSLAASRKAYALTDGWAWLQCARSLPPEERLLEVIALSELYIIANQYNLVTLAAAACPGTREEPARRFAEWLTTPRAQRHIAAFRHKGAAVFYPLDVRASARP